MPAGSELSASTRSISSSTPRSRNCTGDRFTDICRPSSPLSCQIRCWRQALRSTQAVSGAISPMSSASPMNSPGRTRPR